MIKSAISSVMGCVALPDFSKISFKSSNSLFNSKVSQVDDPKSAGSPFKESNQLGLLASISIPTPEASREASLFTAKHKSLATSVV